MCIYLLTDSAITDALQEVANHHGLCGGWTTIAQRLVMSVYTWRWMPQFYILMVQCDIEDSVWCKDIFKKATYIFISRVYLNITLTTICSIYALWLIRHIIMRKVTWTMELQCLTLNASISKSEWISVKMVYGQQVMPSLHILLYCARTYSRKNNLHIHYKRPLCLTEICLCFIYASWLILCTIIYLRYCLIRHVLLLLY